MRTPHFEQVSPTEPPRIVDRPRPDRQKGPGEFARDETTAEKARAAQAEIVRKLRAKTHRWNGDKLEEWPDGPKYAEPIAGAYTPEGFPRRSANILGGDTETVRLEGGPLDGTSIQMRRGENSRSLLAAGPAGEFITANYLRTSRLSNENFPIFDFQPASVAV
jgi:hypothetical protein